MDEPSVGLIGARSLVGSRLLVQLARDDNKVVAFSRLKVMPVGGGNVEWRTLGESRSSIGKSSREKKELHHWVCVAPIWTLSDYFRLMESYGVHRVVAISSTSLFVKANSSNPDELSVSDALARGEASLRCWAERNGIEWIVLRPTLIYGYGQDKNVSELVRIIRRLKFFPLFGSRAGKRQPVHADDIALACVVALRGGKTCSNRSYNLAGGETLNYREMVTRIFLALGRKPRFVTVPRPAFRVALAVLRIFPRYRQWSLAMVERMNADLVFDYSDAQRDLDFHPRPFHLTPDDLPRP